MMIIDNFLDDFDALRAHCDSANYAGTVNPFDGVLYPGITTDIPEHIKAEVEAKVVGLFKRPVDCLHFIRLTLGGVSVPHGAHDDLCMADELLLIYLTRDESCRGGTETVRHIEHGFSRAPIPQEMMDVWRRDANRQDAWEPTNIAPMRPNRAVIIEASKFHRAAHPAGFGSSAHDGRLVYSCFARYV